MSSNCTRDRVKPFSSSSTIATPSLFRTMSDFALKTPIAIFKMAPHQRGVKDEERDLSVSTSSSSCDALRSSTAATSVAEATSTSAPPLALDPVITTSLDSLFRHIVDLATALELEVRIHNQMLAKVYARLARGY